MIDVSDLTFEYDGKTVLRDVSFQIAKNSVVALVGPNGAGKTTLMRCLIGLHKPVSGNILMNGIDVLENPRGVHRCTGYLSDFFGLYDSLTVRQCLLYMAWCQNIPKERGMERVEEVAKLTGLTDYLDKKAGTLSRGYRQRVGVSLAIIHNPQILILDEPASGMDPEARIKLSELMLDLKAHGMTILVSSHILAELEDYCTDMLVIRDGQVREHIIQDQHKDEALMISLKCLDMNERYVEFLTAQKYVRDVKIEGTVVRFVFAGGEEGAAALLKELVRAEIPVISFEPRKKSLQKAYMELAEQAQKSADGGVK